MTEIVLPTSSWREGDVSMLALFQGRLVRTASGELTAEGVRLVWPAGFTAVERENGAAEVLDPDGDVVLAVGDRFEVAGGFGDDGFVMNAYPVKIVGS